MIGGPEIENWSRDRDHVLWETVYPKANTSYGQPVNKIWSL